MDCEAREPPVEGLEGGDLHEHLDREVQVGEGVGFEAGQVGVEEEEALSARGEDDAAVYAEAFGFGAGRIGVDVEGLAGDGHEGAGRGWGEREGRALRGVRRLRDPVEHCPGRTRGGGGEGAAKAAEDEIGRAHV